MSESKNEEADAAWKVVDTWQQECNRAEERHRALEQRIRELVEKWRIRAGDMAAPGECFTSSEIQRLTDCADELAELLEDGK